MMEESKIMNYLRLKLSEKRYTHSLGVADEAKKLAERYNADVNKAYIAGLVHDVAKEVKPDEARELLRDKFGIYLDSVTYNVPKLLHAHLGACFAQTEFGIYDAEILDAIKYHTTAKADMSILTKIIYIADYIEPNRSFDGVSFANLRVKILTRRYLWDLILLLGNCFRKKRCFIPTPFTQGII